MSEKRIQILGRLTNETPHFDLTELGLPAVTIGGNAVELATDTTDIIAALDRGAVKITLAVNMGEVVNATCIINPVGAMGEYVCTAVFEIDTSIHLTLFITETGIMAMVTIPFVNVATELEAINEKLNGIDTLLDAINGEVV